MNLKDILLKEDPFTLKFNHTKLKELIDQEIFSKTEKETIQILFLFHNVFIKSYNNILKIIIDSNLSRVELIKLFYITVNHNYYNINSHIKTNYKSEDQNLNNLLYSKLKIDEDTSVPIVQNLESGGDIINELLSLLDNFESSTFNNCHIDEFSEDKLKDVSILIWNSGYQLYIFKSYFEIIKFEEGNVSVEREGEIVNIIKSDTFKLFSKFEHINSIRSFNRSFEQITFLDKLNLDNVRKNNIISTEIKDGIINFNIGLVDNREFIIENFTALYQSNYEFIEMDINQLNILDFIEIINIISQIFKSEISKSNSKNFKNIHYGINRNNLIDKTHNITNFDEQKIITAIDSIINTTNDNFWRKPLLQIDDTIFVAYALIIAPNHTLLIEEYLKYLGAENIDKQFYNYIYKELVNCNYCKKIEKKEDENKIILEFNDYNLVIETTYHSKYPITSEDKNKYIAELNILSEKIDKKYSKDSNKIIPLIVSNLNIYSGLLINHISIFDIGLLRNYLFTGSLNRGYVYTSDNTLQNKVTNSFKYYENENEFNENLPNFLYQPFPIYDIFDKLIDVRIPTLPSDFKFQFYIDNCDFIKKDDEIINELKAIESALNSQYYFNQNDEIKNIILNRFNYKISVIFQLINQQKENSSCYVNELINIISRTKFDGIIYLLYCFKNSVKFINDKKIKPDYKFKSIEFTIDEIRPILDLIIRQNPKIKINNLVIDDSLSNTQEKKLISFSIEILSHITNKKYNEDEFENFLLPLSIISFYRNKYSLDFFFYTCYNNLISALNHNFLYQQARNLAEDIFRNTINDNKKYKAWSVLLLCSNEQNNIVNSLVYSCLYLTSLSSVNKLDNSDLIESLFSILKFSRKLKQNDIVDQIFNSINLIKINNYDKQKFHLSYYLSCLDRDSTELNKAVIDSINFFSKNQFKIVKYNEQGIVPWLNYFYNLKRFNQQQIIDYNFEEYITILEENIDDDLVSSLRDRHFYNPNSINVFIKNLKNVFSSFYKDDFVYEIKNLEFDANNILENAIKEQNFNNILLTGLVKNDVQLSYIENIEVSGKEVEFKLKNLNDIDFENYLGNIIQELCLTENQIFIYLFSFYNRIFILKINSIKEVSLKEIDNWNSNSFLDNKNQFYFNSVKHNFIEEQEDHYKKLLEEFSFSNLNIDDSFDEILISTNLKLSKTPTNLIINDNDFIGSQFPVTNILQLEWFIKNNNKIEINNLTISCWIPLEDQDATLELGYDKIFPILKEYNINTITKSLPDHILKEKINILFAHGELDKIGFKAISQSEEKIVFNNKSVFGEGEIAILFICHSGSMNQDIFSNKVQSLVYDMISHGYKAVIAPFWALEATIPSFWLKYFLDSLNDGYTLSESVYLANNSLADYKEIISSSFYVPEGRLAMHLYGNPNIKLKNNQLNIK